MKPKVVNLIFKILSYAIAAVAGAFGFETMF